MKFEILAPAGSMESLIAGVRSGADAVYLGGKSFNARRSAGNFDDNELKTAVDYCHSHMVKAYLAINTLISDRELSDAVHYAQRAMQSGIDAFIIQDIGLAKAIRESLPGARLHASTQMSVMTPDGLKMLESMGFSRCVLPREMTKGEIVDISKKTNMELEIFVHGALCMSVSGQCYMSSMIGSRSGNRGLCAQPCRLPFSADKSKSCDLSLKDLSLINDIAGIADCGVMSLKIEGRMKRPEYTAAAVTAVKKAIKGEYTHDDEMKLQSVFSRSGFTNSYFTGTYKDMFGVRRKEDVVAADKVLKEFSHIYDKEFQNVPLTMRFECKNKQSARLEGESPVKKAVITGARAQKAINRPMTEQNVAARLSKLGGTPFFAKNIEVYVDDGLILPASEINAMRRKMCEELIKPDSVCTKSKKYTAPASRTGGGTPYYTARFAHPRQIPENHEFRRIFLPVWCDKNDFIKHNAGVEIPRGIFGKEDDIRKKLLILKENGINKALCGNLGAVKTAEDLGYDVYGDFGLNIYNTESARMIRHPLLSFELTLNAANAINSEDMGIIVYGRVPLMLMRNCPVKNRIGCERCGKNGILTDRIGCEFPIICSPYPCVEALNTVPVYMGDRMDEVKTDYAHFYFSNETPQQVNRIISMFSHREKPDFKYTRGLYQRGTL